MNNGYTVEPMLYVDENGEEQLSYDHANVKDHSYKEAANRQHQEDQKYAISEDNEGNQYHAWDVENPEAYDSNPQPQIQQQQVEEPDDESGFADGDELTDYIYQTQGDAYRRMINWAYDNVDDEFIQRYDRIMDTNDPEKMIEAINTLAEFYNKYH